MNVYLCLRAQYVREVGGTYGKCEFIHINMALYLMVSLAFLDFCGVKIRDETFEPCKDMRKSIFRSIRSRHLPTLQQILSPSSRA